ncbi:MAG: GtrA family protein [Pseudomonadales bacterium]
MVGGVAYLLDVGAFWVLHEYFFSAEVSRLWAFTLAALLTYVLNGRLTFQAELNRKGLVKYLGLQGVGALINLGLFWMAINSYLDAYPVLALTLGAMAGSTFNFLAMRRFVFTDTAPACR